MTENRKFYELIKKEDVFQVSQSNKIIFKLRCEGLVQYGTALAARQANGLYTIYLPRLISKDQYDFTCGFTAVLENVKELYYHQKKPGDNLLLVKVETEKARGYWTALSLEAFEWFLNDDLAKSRCKSLFKIPYIGASRGIIMEDFDYLPLGKFLVQIDESVHFVTCQHGALISESAHMAFQSLGNVSVYPLPFEWCFKVASDKGETIINTYNLNGICREDFGPFYKIEEKLEVKFEQPHPSCYVAYDEHDEIVGMFYGKASKNIINAFTSSIIFDFPVTAATLVGTLNDRTLSSWKLSCGNGDKILLFSINESNFVTILNLSDYV